MCGGDLDVVPGIRIAECEYCGSKQTVPAIDNEKKKTLFLRANRLRSACEFDNAFGIYENIVTEFPSEAEAYWGLILCKYGIEYVDDIKTAKKIPTCHRSSFDSLMDDPDFALVMENADSESKEIYLKEAEIIENLRKGIIDISNREEPYDIFICYKELDEDGNRTIDSVISQEIYNALTEKGYRVFFSRITLEDKLGKEYEPYIFSAINSAKIMLVIGTKYDNFTSVWVKNEWGRFLKLMAKDAKRTLIPCYKGIDVYDMPQEFLKLQALDYGKVGAMQDLIRGIEKIFGEFRHNIVEKEQANDSKEQADNNVSLGVMALEAQDDMKAERLFEEALKLSPNHLGAYLGMIRIAKDEAQMTPYINAVLENDMGIIKEYLISHPRMIGSESFRAQQIDQRLLRKLLFIIKSKTMQLKVIPFVKLLIEMEDKNILSLQIRELLQSWKNVELIEAVLKRGGDANGHIYLKGKTSKVHKYVMDASYLSCAVINGDLDMVKLFIKYGANVNYISVEYECTGVLIPNKGRRVNEYSVLFLAIMKNNIDIAKLLLENDVNVEAGMKEYMLSGAQISEWSPLAWTIRCRSIEDYSEIMTLLLKHGANPNYKHRRLIQKAKDDMGNEYYRSFSINNALTDTLIYKGDENIIPLLLEYGADVKGVYEYYKYAGSLDSGDYTDSKDGDTTRIPILGLAIQKRKAHIVKLLIEKGASFDEKCRDSYHNEFLLRDLWYSDEVLKEMGKMIGQYGWKGSTDGFFKKANKLYYGW